MNILGTLSSWARAAWGAVAGIPSDVGHGLQSLWHYASSLHNVMYYLVGGPLWRVWWRAMGYLNIVSVIYKALHRGQQRVPGYINLTQVAPLRSQLVAMIGRLRLWTALQLLILRVTMQALFTYAMLYTRQLVGIERAQRIQADTAEHAAMLKAVAACLATVQKQAASGYNSVTRDRLTPIEKLLNDLADRAPAIRGLVSLLVKSVIDLETIDNPVLRWVISKTLAEIIGHLGVDKATGDLLGRLLGPLTGGGPPQDLAGVERDVAQRLNALEAQWADFMAAGGPEVEQAGQEWKALTGVLADVTILGMFTLAVADPQAWATGVSDTVGVALDDTLTAIVDLIT